MSKNQKVAMSMADEIQEMSMDEMKALPGFLGKLAPVQVQYNGFYAYHNTTRDLKICIVEKK